MIFSSTPRKTISHYAAMDTPNCSFSIIEADSNETGSEINAIKDVFPNTKLLILRPFIKLTGQQKGYFWSPNSRGLWREFMDDHKKHYTIKNTGN